MRFLGQTLCIAVLTLTVQPGLAVAQLNDPIPTPIPQGDITIRLESVASGLVSPLKGVPVPGFPAAMAVVDQPGQLRIVNLNTGTATVVLDLSAQLVNLFPFSDERGFLGLAFHPQFSTNGKLYVYISVPNNGPADYSTLPQGSSADHQTLIAELTVNRPARLGNGRGGVTFTPRALLRIDQPQSNHNGGDLGFGADDLLYISLGDGGASDDSGTGHGDNGNGIDPSNPLGAILRIDPLGNNAANGNYGIPADNPLLSEPTAAPEVYAFGFRNPYRFSFDSATGDLYVGDVGQNDIEELDVVVAGGNYGWKLKEGSFFFDDNGNGSGFVTDVNPGIPANILKMLIDPVAEYDHDEGFSIIGGFVYRGTEFPALAGRYIFADFVGRLFYLGDNDELLEFQVNGNPMSVLGFGQDANGEVYVLSNQSGSTTGTTGVVQKIVMP